jgi:hypothetical protein
LERTERRHVGARRLPGRPVAGGFPAGRPALGPAAVVLACAGSLWLFSGVRLVDVVLFLGYEVLLVLAPGWLVYAALRPSSTRLERLACGWALGYALGIAAFGLTAALDARAAFLAYPALAGAVAVWTTVRRTRPRTERGEPGDARWSWAVAGIVIVALVLVAASVFPAHPLPGSVPSVAYYIDLVFQLSIAAEALHHWPVTDPLVSGEPLPYHTFVHMHMAAVAQVTGIELPVVVFRLVLLPLVALFVLQAAFAGARVGGRRWIGPVAAVLVLLVSEVDLDPRSEHGTIPFLGVFFVGLWLSPTFLLGLVFFIPTVVLLVELVADRERRTTWRDWILLAVFMAGATGAKAAVPPVVVGGLALFMVVQRRFDSRSVGALALSGGIFGAFLLTMYRGGDAGLRLGFPAAIGYPLQLAREELGSLPSPLVSTGLVAAGLVALFAAPMSGLLWFVRGGRIRLAQRHKLLLSMFAVALVPYLVMEHSGHSQLFFTDYGYVAAGLVSATGIYWLLFGSIPGGHRVTRSLVLLAAAVGGGLVLAVGLSLLVTSNDKVLYLAWYALLSALVLGLWVAVARAPPSRRPFAVRRLLVAVLAAAVLNVPLDVGPGLLSRWREGALYDREPGLTRGLHDGLEWLRDRTSPDAVIAVNGYDLKPGTSRYDNFNYSAFAERRTFLEGWLYANRKLDSGPEADISGPAMPYSERFRLNEAVFRRGDRTALRALVRDYGVRYLVVDRLHGGAGEVSGLGRLVFSNRDVAIYEPVVDAARGGS